MSLWSRPAAVSAVGVSSLLLLLGCPGPAAPESTSTPSSPTPVVEIDCTDACASTDDEAAAARCYACQCKSAMDGWLPSPSELQCAHGEEIVIYTADEDGALHEAEGAPETCANPTRLYGTCASGGRLGQLTHGDVQAKWICRRNELPDDVEDPPYDDVGLILHNERTGATCFFDDRDGTGLANDNWPNLDLTAPEASVDDWLDFFYFADGTSCVSCHDSDPFVYTPYLRSTDWRTGMYATGAFSLVTLEGDLAPTGGTHLVSPEAEPCTSCHRIGSGATCSSFAADAMGEAEVPGMQSSLIASLGDPTSPLWPVLTWMPTSDAVHPDEWEDTYGAARNLVAACCAFPGASVGACDWEPMPR